MEVHARVCSRWQSGGLTVDHETHARSVAKPEVFISHISVEAHFADLLRERMRRDFIGLMGFFVSTDSSSIPVGTQWFDEVVAALRRARVQLIVCSSVSVREPWIHYEAGAARIRDIVVIPLCHSGVTPETLPVPLNMTEGALLSDPHGLRKVYSRVAAMFNCDVPEVDFDAYARDFEEIEEMYAAQRAENDRSRVARSGERLVKDPHVLCVSSPQYVALGFQNQLQAVLDAFPADLRHERVISAHDLTQALARDRCDIVHIAAYVCPRGGDLYFSEVNLGTGKLQSDKDVIPAQALAMLLRKAATRLVVIASHDSLALATELLPVTNVIAPTGIVSASAMAVWIRTFYGALGTHSLTEAFDLALTMSRAPMKMLAQQSKLPEMDIEFTSARTTGWAARMGAADLRLPSDERNTFSCGPSE